MTLITTQFTNPRPDLTTNGGGWSVNVSAISNPPYWAEVGVTLMKKSIPIASMGGVRASNADIYVEKSASTEMGSWYLREGMTGLVDQVKFSDGAKGTPISLDGARSEMFGDRSKTVQMAYFIVVDADSSGTVTAADFILVFADPNADGAKEIVGNCTLELAMHGTTIATAALFDSMLAEDIDAH